MKILMIILSGVILVNNHDMGKERFESITHTKVVEQYKIIPNEVVQQDVAKKATSKKTTKKATKKKITKKKTVKKAKKKAVKKKKTTKKKTNKKIYKKYKVQSNVSEIKQYAHNLVLSYGWNENDWNAFVQIINHESSWRVTAKNPKSGAYGLCQAYPASKMKSAGSDWRTNYKTQLKWCMGYIKGRYGSPSSAWSFWQKHHWY